MATEDLKYSSNTLNKDYGLKRSLAHTRAKIEESISGKIYIIIDGKRIEADRNDLFGMNKSNPTEWLERLVDEYDRQMKKNEEKISFLEKQEAAIKTALKKVRNAFWSLLARCGVRSINQIEDESQRAEAISLNNQRWDLSFTKTGINNQLHSALLDNFLTACDKGKAVNDFSFNQAMFERLS